MAAKRPLVFIGSSTEGLPVAKAIQLELQRTAECVVWSQGVFGLNEGGLDSLVQALDTFDFAILALTADDLVMSRGDTQAAPRDNVLLELGMFIGGLGRERTFMVVDRTAEVKLPSDLAGITPASFQPPDGGTMQSAVGPACTTIDGRIRTIGCRQPELPVGISGSCFNDFHSAETRINFVVSNQGEKDIPPYKVGIFHPKRGAFFTLASDKSGPLLPDQKRTHSYTVIVNGAIHDSFSHRFFDDPSGNPLTEEDYKDHTFRLVLEDSDKVLYENGRIGRGFVALVQEARKNGSHIGGTSLQWAELDNSLPDELPSN